MPVLMDIAHTRRTCNNHLISEKNYPKAKGRVATVWVTDPILHELKPARRIAKDREKVTYEKTFGPNPVGPRVRLHGWMYHHCTC